MQSQARFLSSLVRTVSFAVVATLVMASGDGSSLGTEFSSTDGGAGGEDAGVRFSAGSSGEAPRPAYVSALARAKMHRWPLDSNDIYDNGPTNGNTDAWTINFGFIVSDSFNVTDNNTSVTGMSFAAWMSPGDVLSSAELSITSGENGGTSYFDQTVNFTQGTCTSNQFGYNVCTETASLQWPDPGCRHLLGEFAERQRSQRRSGFLGREQRSIFRLRRTAVGTIPSESFTILGSCHHHYHQHDLREFLLSRSTKWPS